MFRQKVQVVQKTDEIQNMGSSMSELESSSDEPNLQQSASKITKMTLHEAAKAWVPDEKGAREEATALHEVLQAKRVDTDAVIALVARNCSRRRREISDQYRALFGKELDFVLGTKLRSRHLCRAVRVSMMPLCQLYAQELRHAMSGFLFNDNLALIEMLCTIDHETLREVNKTYWQVYKMSLEFDLKRNTGGYFQRLLVLLSLNRRAQDVKVDDEAARADAKDLFEAGEGRLGTDECTFNRVLTTRSFPQLLKVFEEYEALNKHPVETAIRREFSGKLEQGLLSLVRVIRNRPGFVAEQLYHSMYGLGTSNWRLTRLVVTQVEGTDMEQVKQAFQDMYGVALATFIADDTSGDFRKFLLAMIGETDDPEQVTVDR